MLTVYFTFPNGRSVDDEMPADMLPRIGETLVDGDRGERFLVTNVVRRIADGRLQRSVAVHLERMEGSR